MSDNKGKAMLWRLTTHGTPLEKVTQALDYYKRKYKEPKFVFARSEFLGTLGEVPNITLEAAEYLQAGHIVISSTVEEYIHAPRFNAN